jgi:hypothetical protein
VLSGKTFRFLLRAHQFLNGLHVPVGATDASTSR